MQNRKPDPEVLLHSVFGYDTFREHQRDVIQAVLNRQDTLAIMPTGGGKSLCYQIPSLIFEGLTVVVSPLISLMQDQVTQLNALGIPAVVLNSSLDWDTYRDNMDAVRRGRVRLLYVAPETLLTDRLGGLLDNVNIDLLTVDEAHCISEWGHDFRPEYRQLAEVRRQHPKATVLALTATATQRVREDIQSALGFKRQKPFIASFNRPNLFLEVQPKKKAAEQTVQFLRQFKDQSGIVYCFSRQQVETLTDELSRKGFSVRAYHAGMSDEDRRTNQEAFVRDDVQIMVATIAFGMGINKPNVRFIVHYDLPRNIESYYQQIGRAGRDGLPAHCLLLYSYGDTRKQQYFINQKEEPERSISLAHLRALTDYAETYACRRIPLLKYFGENFPAGKCETCDNCTGKGSSAKEDLTEQAALFFEAMVSSGERFGAMHIVDILLGEYTEKVGKFNHDELSCFGTGKALNRRAWLDFSRQLQDLGYLELTQYKGLRLSAKGTRAMQRGESITGAPVASEPRTTAKTRREKQPPASTGSIPLLEYDVVLFGILRDKRKEIADQERVPAYVILPDRALVEIATYLPLSLNSLANIHGIGEVKLKKYGPAFLQVVQEYSRKKALGK